MLDTPKYVLSTKYEVEDASRGVIRNVDSGKRFEISTEGIRLIRRFRSPLSLRGADRIFKPVDGNSDSILEFIRKLIKDGILVEIDNRGQEKKARQNFSKSAALVESPPITFFSSPSGPPQDVRKGAITFIGAPFDLGTTGFPGARYAPDRMRQLSSEMYQYQTDIGHGAGKGFFSIDHREQILQGARFIDLGNVVHYIGENFDQFYDRVGKVLDTVFRKQAFPVLVGGDHSITYASIRACRKKFGQISVVHVDAHTDLGDLLPHTANNHGNVFTRVLREKLSDRLIQLGVRGGSGEILEDSRYALFSTRELVSERGLAAVAKAISTGLPCYLTLDIDALDPTFAPGTGTPVPLGLDLETLNRILEVVVNNASIVGFDIVEVNPMRDFNDKTSHLANRIILDLLIMISRKKPLN